MNNKIPSKSLGHFGKPLLAGDTIEFHRGEYERATYNHSAVLKAYNDLIATLDEFTEYTIDEPFEEYRWGASITIKEIKKPGIFTV